jgi:hypothetical protein
LSNNLNPEVKFSLLAFFLDGVPLINALKYMPKSQPCSSLLHLTALCPKTWFS